MEKKSVIYLGNFGRPEFNAAGKRVYGNALLLSKLGYKVTLIGKSNDYCINNPIFYTNEICFYSFPNVGKLKTTKYINYLKDIIKKEGNPSMIIRYGSPGLALFDKELLKFCKKMGVTIIADVVDWLPASGNNIFFNAIKRFDTYLEKGIFNKKSDGIISISSYLANYYKKHGCTTTIIPPLVEDYKKNNTINKKLKLIYAGIPFRLGRKVDDPSEVKDRIDLVIDAIAQVVHNNKNIELNIYGLSKEQYITAYPDHRDLLDRLNNYVLFHGKKSMDEVQIAVNSSDYMILIRDITKATMAGFPTKVVESLSNGTPVITTKTSDLDQFILHGENGFFVSNDRESLVNDINKIAKLDLSIKQEMKNSCFKKKDFLFLNYMSALKSFLDGLTI